MNALSPAAEAFDAIAPVFDDRFGAWLSVRAQRNAVRGYVQDVLSSGSHILEIGGGTGEDAQWFVDHGYRVHLTDASPTMVARAREKLTNRVTTEVLPAESFATWTPDTPFDAAFSNFAALNCVDDLAPFARGLAGALRTGGHAFLVLFGPFPPAEVAVQLILRKPVNAFRRLHRAAAPASLGGRRFTVRYHRPAEIEAAMKPFFTLHARRGIGIFVPPSAAEPWISRHPRLLHALESIDKAVTRPLALLGDHVLYHFQRTND